MKFVSLFRKIAISVTCLGVGVSTVNAAATNWTSTSNGAWETASNWNSGLPVTSSTATISQNISATLTSNAGSIGRLAMGVTTGTSRLTIGSGGVLASTDARLGLGAGSKNAELTVTGGTLAVTGLFYLGVVDGAQAVVTVKNEGKITSGTFILGASTNQTATFNIGGNTIAEAAGTVGGLITGTFAGAGSTSTLNFNHTSTRYEFGTGVRVESAVTVNAKAGVTVLTGTNKYTGKTTVNSGAVLLANNTLNLAGVSSTGTGEVAVHSGGVLGGIGYVGGNTVVSGTLKPGDYDYQTAVPTNGTLRFKTSLELKNGSTTIFAINGNTRGSGYSAIDVVGSLTLDGTFKLVLGEDFSIANNETISFQLFNVQGGITGSYADFQRPDSWEGLTLNWNTTQLSTNGLVSVTAVPEPSALLIGVSGLAFLVLRRRVLRA